MTGAAAPLSASRIVGVFGAVMMTAQFQRTAMVVIAPELAVDPGLTPEQIGLLGGAYFFLFSALTIPIGVLIDRVGPRRLVASQLLLAGFAIALFAAAEDFWTLLVARALIGLGNAGVVIAGFVVISRWFEPRRFTHLTSWQNGIGGLGALMATAPLAAATAWVGWRAAIGTSAAATLAVALAVLFLVRDAPPGHASEAARTETLRQTLGGMLSVVRLPRFACLYALGLAGYAVLSSVNSLWAGLYLRDVHVQGDVARGGILLALGIASILGNLVYGQLDRRLHDPKGIGLAGLAATTAVLAALALIARPGLGLAIGLLLAFALFGPYPLCAFAHARALIPEHLFGRGLATVNLAFAVGVALVQMLSGLVVGAFPRTAGLIPEDAFRALFALFAALTVAAGLVYAYTPRHVRETAR